MKTIKLLCLLGCAVITLMVACTDEAAQVLTPEFSADAQEIVAGEEVSFRDESLGGNPSKWNWYFEGGSPDSSILFSPKVKYETPGTYSVRLVVGRGSNSQTITRESFITVNHPSVITVDFTADKTIATNEDVITFTDLSVGYPTEWRWEFTPPLEGAVITSSEQHPSLTFVPGIYTVKLTATNPPNTSSSKTMTDYLTVIDKYSVAANFAAQARMTYAGGSIHFRITAPATPQAGRGPSREEPPATSGEQNPPVVTYAAAGRYKVTLTTSNEINSSTITKEAYVSVIPAEELVLFYPFDGSSADAGPHGLNPTSSARVR